MLNGRISYLGSVLAAALWLTPPAANATVIIGLQEAGINGGAITTVATNSGGAASFAGVYGTFTVNFVSGIGQPVISQPDLLNSSSQNVSSRTAGTLKIFITSTDNFLPSHADSPQFSWSYTSNLLPTGWQATLQTYVDPGNGILTTTSLLGSHTFSTIGTTVGSDIAFAGPDLFSVTEVYTITSTGGGTALSTIDLQATPIPEPASLLLLGASLVGLGVIGRRRLRVV